MSLCTDGFSNQRADNCTCSLYARDYFDFSSAEQSQNKTTRAFALYWHMTTLAFQRSKRTTRALSARDYFNDSIANQRSNKTTTRRALYQNVTTLTSPLPANQRPEKTTRAREI